MAKKAYKEMFNITISEMEIKTTVGQLCIPIRVAKIEKKYQEERGEIESLLYFLQKCKMRMSLENNLTFLIKLNT